MLTRSLRGFSLRGFYLRFGEAMDAAANARVQALSRRLLGHLLPGVTDLIPGYASLYVEYDVSVLTERRVRKWVERQAQPAQTGGAGREVEIPVAYDGVDLPAVAERAGLTPEEVVKLHSATSYRVYAMGFAPGFPFMGEVPPELRAPRHPSPRKHVPAHSVAIAGSQTGIYPLPSPGGWQLLGSALSKVYDPRREEPFLLEPGDSVRFTPAAGTPPIQPEPVSLLPAEPQRPLLMVREPGVLDLLMDRGRFLVGRFGLSRSGPLDYRSASLANALVGNSADAPMLEMNLTGPVLEALSSGVVAFAGWGLAPLLNGQRQPPFLSFAIRPGDVLSFDSEPGGCRGYLAIAGGIEAKSFAGSASTDLKALIGSPLAEGDVLGTARSALDSVRQGFSFTPYRWPQDPVLLRLLPGPQASPAARGTLTAGPSNGVFVVAAADRMGLRLEGDEVPGGELLSEATPIGAVQVPPNGSPILLLNDRGTLGGYRKPAIIHPADLHKAGQLRAGNRVRFVWAERR